MSWVQDSDDGQEADRPLAAYALLAIIFNAIFGVLMTVAHRRGRDLGIAGQPSAGNLLLLGIATHKISRLVAKDRVTSPIRAPFTTYDGPASASEVNERPSGHGIRLAIGELLTCPFCVSQWIAMLLGFGSVFYPRPTRVIASVFSMVAISDLLNELIDLLRTLRDRVAVSD